MRNTNLSCVSGSIREEVSLQTVLLKSQKLVSFWRKVRFSLSSNRFRMVEKCRMKAQPVHRLKHRPGETFCLRKALPKKGGSLKGVLYLLCPKTHAGEPLWGRGWHLRQQILGQRLVSCAFVVPLQFHAALGGYLSWGAAGKRPRQSNTLYII